VRVSFPGFFDLQVNGFAGVDFNTPGRSPAELGRAAAALRATGVTRYLATLITSPLERFAACARALVAADPQGLAGLHLEGPYLSPAEGARGAHSAEHQRAADPEDFARRQEAAGGRIVLVTLAPEVPGALGLIERLRGQGVRVAIGHTLASGAQIADAIRAGATLSTHLGNGCPALLPRHENMIWEQLAADALAASLIADGIHLPPAVFKSLVRAKGLARSILVTDATAAAAAPPGRYPLGEAVIERGPDGRIRQPGSEYLAGSALTMDAAVGNAARFCGLPLADVLPLATSQPAGAVGQEPAGQISAEWDPAGWRLEILAVADGPAPKG
jgi:N-acetylglucosamine-6-phosphate deacetylase